jgi:hypothetical protein
MGVSGQVYAPVALTPEKVAPLLTGYGTWCAQEAVWTVLRVESCTYWNSNSEPLAVQPVASYDSQGYGEAIQLVLLMHLGQGLHRKH